MSPFRCSGVIGRHPGLRSAPVTLLVLALAVPSAPQVWAQSQPTLLQRLRAMLGIIRPITVGGSRASLPAGMDPDVLISAIVDPRFFDAAGLCLLSPWMQAALGPVPSIAETAATAAGSPLPVEIISGAPLLKQVAGASAEAPTRPVPVAITPSGTPPIASVTPLAEVQIWRGDTLLWTDRGTATAPLPNPLAWPLPPLQPGESVLLKVRMQNAEDPAVLSVELRRPLTAGQAPPAKGSDSALALESLLRQGRSAEAVELLFQSDLAGNAELRQLARSAMASGCRGLR